METRASCPPFEERAMKILVIEDSVIHQQAAHQTLTGNGHDVTMVCTYDEAYRLINGDFEENPEHWDAVLCDLLMPASEMEMGEKGLKYVGQEMPVGFALSLMAAMRGAKYVAVVTDTSHHDHPAAAMLDELLSTCPNKHDSDGSPPKFNVNGAIFGFYHNPFVHVDETICSDCKGSGKREKCHCVEQNSGTPKADCYCCHGVGEYCHSCGSSGKQWGKDWGSILKHLVTCGNKLSTGAG